MALDPVPPADAIWVTQQTITGLDANGEIVPKSGYEGAERPDLTEQEKRDMYAATFASEYDSYAKAGVVGGAANGTEDPSILETFLQGISITDPTAFGQAITDYWATVKLANGTAQVLDEVVSVTNDASTLSAAFISAVSSSITTTLGTPPYYDVLIANVEAVAKTITWSVTEVDNSSGSTTVYPRTIS